MFDIDDIIPSLNDVLEGLMNLDLNKGAGPDNVTNHFLKQIANNIAKPLHYIFVTSLRNGIFPDNWKKSFIVPIHKGGSKADISNYKGIAILYVL